MREQQKTNCNLKKPGLRCKHLIADKQHCELEPGECCYQSKGKVEVIFQSAVSGLWYTNVDACQECSAVKIKNNLYVMVDDRPSYRFK